MVALPVIDLTWKLKKLRTIRRTHTLFLEPLMIKLIQFSTQTIQMESLDTMMKFKSQQKISYFNPSSKGMRKLCLLKNKLKMLLVTMVRIDSCIDN